MVDDGELSRVGGWKCMPILDPRLAGGSPYKTVLVDGVVKSEEGGRYFEAMISEGTGAD